MATISLFGSASTPADNAANAGSGVTLTPVASMKAGMLVIALVQVRFTGIAWVEIDFTNKGGQQWHEIVLDDPSTTYSTTLVSGRLYACIFNGVWSASPAWDGAVPNGVTAAMDVFQLDDPAFVFDLDVMVSGAVFAAGTTRTNAAITTLTNGALVWTCWLVPAANTWSSLTAGWSYLGAANQIRNTSGGQSMSRAYKVQSSAGTTGAIANTQSASTAGLGVTIAFKAVASSVVYPTTRPTINMLIDHEASVDGTVITPTILQGCCEPSAPLGAWSATGGVAVAVSIAANAELKLSHQHGLQLISSLQEFNDGAATRGALYNHTLGAETPSFNFDFAIGGTTHPRVSIGFFFRTSYQLGNLASFSSIALFSDPTGEFTVWNILAQFATEYVSRLECNLSPGLVCGAHLLANRTYWITMLMDTTNSVSKLAIFDVDANWRRHGFTTYLPILGTSPVNRLQIYCTGGGYVPGTGFTQYDDFALDWTNAVFPLLPGVGGTVPPPPIDYAPIGLRM